MAAVQAAKADVEVNVGDNSLNVLVYGSGAREHSIADAIKSSPLLNKLYIADAGFAKLGEEIKFKDFEDLAQKCVKKKIDIAIFGSEEPLCEGVVDIFNEHQIHCIGVNKHFSQLESSKLFGKKFIKKYGIKTADYDVITENNRPDYNKLNYPVVIKADGLCKGKGVVTAYNKAFAKKTIDEFLDGKFGEASKTVLLEEFLQGEELSLMSLWDGNTLLHFTPARDFKRLNKSPSAPNTGGLGAFCPVVLNSFQQKKLDEYKMQLEVALRLENADFCGFIYSGLILAKEKGSKSNWDWHVLEYNVRPGDPETQATLVHLKTDFLKVLKSAVDKKLDAVKLEYQEESSACLVLACEGYPKESQYIKDGQKITMPDDIADIKIFYSGVEEKNGQLYSKGGRVMSLCTTSSDPFWTLKKFAKEIEMNHKYFRTDMEIN